MLNNCEKYNQKDNGFTLIELIMTIIILGFTSIIMIPFVTSIAHSPDPVIRQQAISLGQALMDEILAKKWDNGTPLGGGALNTVAESSRGSGWATVVGSFGPDIVDGEATTASNDRRTWDDVDDYANLSETPGNLRDQDNNSVSLVGFSRSVRIDYIASNAVVVTANSATSGASTDTKRIVVTVESPQKENFEFVALRCNY